MSEVHTNLLKPCNPFLEYTTTTSTTTVAPTLEYFSLPPSGSVCPDDPCFCGSLLVPVGKKHDPAGSYVIIGDYNYPLVHDEDALVDKSNTLVVTTTKLDPSPGIVDSITIELGQELSLIHVIEVVVKIRETRKVLGRATFGVFGSNTPTTRLMCHFNAGAINLYNLTLQIEIKSLCQSIADVCCDKLPSSIEVDDLIIDLPTTTTTEPPIEPFCQGFALPNSFFVNVLGYGLLSGQSSIATVNRYGNTWSTSGTFPCGANFAISMTCNSLLGKFVYDGSIDCCEEATKSIIVPSDTPYLYPNAITPEIVSYTDCFCSHDCIDGTTTTTTTDFPTSTTNPPQPPLPCSPPNEEEGGSDLIIRGYAIYHDSPTVVLFDSIGELTSQCYGGHWCDRTDFIPQLITESQILEAAQISLNNGSGGGDRLATFSFSIPDPSILSGGASVSLKCVNPPCHLGVTWVVLIAEWGGNKSLIFNSCVVPNDIDDLVYECISCCKWDGVAPFYFDAACNEISENVSFFQISENLWEVDIYLPCGDRFNAIFKCNPDIEFDENSPDLEQLCKNKWEIVHASFPCATNFRLTGNLIELCECNKPPVFEFTADDFSDCECCQPEVGLGLGYLPDSQTLGSAPDGYSWIMVDSVESLYQCKVLFGCRINSCSVPVDIPPQIMSELTDWINAGGVFVYQDEYTGCGNMSATNAVMSAIGSTLTSQGGIFGNGGAYIGTSSSSPCVNGLLINGAATAEIAGGIELVYANPEIPYLGASAMRGEYLGKGCAILIGDTNLPHTDYTSSIEWMTFVERLLTLPSNQLL